MCTDAGEQRSRLQVAAAQDSRTAAEQHQTETAELRHQLNSARDDISQLQKQVGDASDHQSTLVIELRRMAQQLSSSQMELEASRAIASAQRETILVREAEVARLEARLGLSQHSINQSVQPGHLLTGDDTDLAAAVSVTSCPQPSVEVPSVSSELHDTRSTGVDVKLRGSIEDGSLRASGNPDSLLAIWRQLQLNDSAHQSSAGDSSIMSTKVSDPRSTIDQPPRATSVRLGSALEEKARVQSRIKALIGYRDPVKKSVPVTKPRMSVRPQLLSHSKSTTLSTSVKPQRRTCVSDSVKSSQNSSTAVSRYTASSIDLR